MYVVEPIIGSSSVVRVMSIAIRASGVREVVSSVVICGRCLRIRLISTKKMSMLMVSVMICVRLTGLLSE